MSDIEHRVTITFEQAALGTRVRVLTLQGMEEPTVPPGTEWSAIRLAGRGVERGDQKGDQFVEIRVVVPKQLGDAGREALERLSKEHPIDARVDLAW